MYSQDGTGLGHLRRSFNIASVVRARNPRCDVLIVADSPAVSILGSTPGIELLKLPTIVKRGPWSWENATLSLPVRRLVQLRSQLLARTLSEFRPDTVLVDHMPVGAMGELKPMLERALRLRRPPRLFLGLRDILDRPSAIRPVWQQLGAYDYLGAYEAVLVYGERAIYDASASYGLAPHARRIVYCSYIAPPRLPRAARPAGTRPLLLMMGGGGADAYPLADAFCRAVAGMGELGVRAVLLTGPNMAPAQRDRLAAFRHVRVEREYRSSNEWIARASAIVTMAGYNSLTEVLTWRRKAVVVPRSGPSAEQRMRSGLFSERSLVRRIDPEQLEPDRLRAALVELLASDGIPDLQRMPALDGADAAASVLLEPAASLAALEPAAVAPPAAASNGIRPALELPLP
jgi:predicted glycosyltransferase